MWTPILVFYGFGGAATAVILLRTQMFKGQYLLNTVSVLLWPFYWSLYLATLFLNRRRG